MERRLLEFVWLGIRLSLSFILLWAFFDKLLGLGYATAPHKAWVKGISPTYEYLNFAVKGPFSLIFKMISGNIIVDILFMGGLLLIGTALLLGVGLKLAGYTGALLMFLLWLSALPSKNNPILDHHIIYLLILLIIPYSKHAKKISLNRWWKSTFLVKKYPMLE